MQFFVQRCEIEKRNRERERVRMVELRAKDEMGKVRKVRFEGAFVNRDTESISGIRHLG